jgi:hypothetical protein
MKKMLALVLVIGIAAMSAPAAIVPQIWGLVDLLKADPVGAANQWATAAVDGVAIVVPGTEVASVVVYEVGSTGSILGHAVTGHPEGILEDSAGVLLGPIEMGAIGIGETSRLAGGPNWVAAGFAIGHA